MKDILMMGYILVWPTVVAVMMFLMGRGILRDMRKARRNGEDLV
ncbi:putative transporter small subunit [Novilysobacter defluvii]|uniref:Membrane protein n=1 Tax=Lysobacter defluvii IMMIB APB-9 = DSM 18482 TaxID=1385515 RepID=A0A0A0MAC2_9GAMM|nr:putative transporter small subunit [Lysobacter defluvii]KGO98967.1 membrane protein [Lysobacter defluvii IMMIB APB-9 = DSM 18482]